jgi:hypothetical protein
MSAARALMIAAVLSAATASIRADDAKLAAEPIAPSCSPAAAPACCGEKCSLLKEWLASHHCCSEKKSCDASKCGTCGGHLWAWLTYRAEGRQCCCPRFRPPCAAEQPPLWAYFLEGCNGSGGCCNHTSAAWNGPSNCSACKGCGTCSTCTETRCHFLASLGKKKCDKETCTSDCASVKEEAKPASK